MTVYASRFPVLTAVRSQLTGAAMDVCVENVFTASAIEAINVIQATAEENDRAASFDPRHGHRETAAGQEAVAQSLSNDPRASASPASSPETPQAETAEEEKNPWSAWAWLGLCRTREEKNLGPKGS